MITALIVDDDAEIGSLWAEVLSGSGIDVRVVTSGAQGVDIARAEKVDLLVTDILMPDKDGIETLIEIRSIRPQVKVIAVSGGGDGENPFLDVARKLGADASLAKPVELGTLEATVREVLGDMMPKGGKGAE